MTHPIPSTVLAGFSSGLSSSSDPTQVTLPCGKKVPKSLASVSPCDLDMLVVQVSTDDDSAKKPFTVSIPLDSNGKPRAVIMDVVCGVRPMQNAGAGQKTDDKSKMRLVRKPAQVAVTAHYAAQCGQHDHPGILIDPEGSDGAICEPKLVKGSTAKFEAFRRRNLVESSRQYVDGGPIFAVIRLMVSFIEGDGACGSVVIAADSCGVRASGPCVGQLATTLMLYSEDEIELSFTMPPLGGVSRKKEGKDKSAAGEFLLDDKGQKKDAKDAYTRQVDTRYQGFLGYREESESTAKLYGGNATSSSTVTDAGWNSRDATASGYVSGGAWSAQKADDHSGIGNYLTQRGFALSLKHNGEELGIEGVKSFIESCKKIDETISHFREIWEAGIGVKASVGWSSSWQLQFLQISGSGKWSRKVPAGASRLARYREGKITLTPVSGSATASFGISVVIQRLSLEFVNIDLTVSLTLAGSVSGAVEWKAQRVGDADWSAATKRKLISGEVMLTFKATAKVAMLGRTVGCQLAVASGLVAEGVLSSTAGGFEEAKVSLRAVVFTVTVWIGSTGEADYSYEQDVFEMQQIYECPATAS